MKISVNSPSYRRADGVLTLKFYPKCRVFVDGSEVEEYREKNPGAEIVECPEGVQGNYCRVRNYILDSEYERGMDAVALLDDDISYLAYFERKKRKRISIKGFEWFLLKYSILAEDLGVRMWGVNVNQDKQSYREYTPFSMVAYIGGRFSVHVRSQLRYEERLVLKEDYDLTLQHLNRFRRVLRLNKFHYVCKQGLSGTGQKGGASGFRNLEIEREQLERLIRKWGPKIVRYDRNERSHSRRKGRKFEDLNPVIKVPIRGV